MVSDESSTALRDNEEEHGAPEDRERAAARRRGEALASARAASGGQVSPATTRHSLAGRASTAAHAFAALAENVRDYAIFLIDPDGVITFWGEGARLIKWWSKEQAEGAHLRLLYPAGGSEDGTAEGHLQAAAERGEYTGEGNRVRSDGSTFWAGITLTALRDTSGELLGFAKVTRDLTARRAADTLLQSAAEAAEAARADAVAASAAKSGFLATMSHEIRTPVNAILGYHELLDLEIDGPLTAGQRRYLARAGASARHLLALITEVLDFSRIEADQVAITGSAFRVGDAVAGAIALVLPQAHERGLEVTDAVSGFAAGLAAWGDEQRVRQILINLLANAVKFTTVRAGEPGRITVSAGTATQPSPEAELAGDGPWVYVRVEDTGTGIPADRLQPIFEAFVQADMTLTRQHGGTGLGLAISRRLARLMGGDVTARSQVNVGSTFFLWLPAAPVETLEKGGLEGHRPGGEPAASGPTEQSRPAGVGVTPGRQLRAVANAVMEEIERVLHAYVARVRTDPAIQSANRESEAQIENHVATFLADIAGTLYQLDDAPDVVAGAPTPDLVDGATIQRVVADRHGAQRARLGWSEAELERELAILHEELAAAVRRAAPRHLDGPTPSARQGDAERALELLAQFMALAKRMCLAGYWRERAAAPGGTPDETPIR